MKTPTGQTKRTVINETVMQGSVWGPLCCTTTMDKIGQKAYKTGSTLYKYKGMVSVPPLGMVDDELTIAECGPNATITNSVMNTFTESKKLRFGIKKCNKMHIGQDTLVCEDIKVHEDIGKTVVQDKYVGDVLEANGSNKANIKERVDKGYGIVNEILSILSEIPLGPFRMSVGLKLREAMFLNGVLFNSEIWYKVKEDEEQKLSDVDEFLLRSILGVPSKTPKEALFLETGCVPIKFILKQRRLMYLHHILKRPQSELIRKVYEAQKSEPSKGDWYETVTENLIELNVNKSDEQISQMSKYKFRKLLKKMIHNSAFDYLMRKKQSHSKMSDIEYNKLEMQRYLKSDSGLSDAEKQFLVKFRLRMASLRKNFQNQYQDKKCQLCSTEDEDQIHLFRCTKLLESCVDLANNIEIEFEDIFGSLSKQKKAVMLLMKIWDKREELIKQQIADQCTLT